MQRPLDYTRIEVAREISEWTILVASQSGHGQRRLLSAVD